MVGWTEDSRLLFVQHGMGDTHHAMARLAAQVAPPSTRIVAPDFPFLMTFAAIQPLIDQIEQVAAVWLQPIPQVPVRILATSLGGVVWLEVLDRHPQWWERVESLVLLGVPVGGADLARILDPWGWGLGMAKGLGQNRRTMAERISARIPTLAVAGSLTHGDDGTIPLESTKFHHAHWVSLPGVSHPALRWDPQVAAVIRSFWAQPQPPLPRPAPSRLQRLIDHFRAVPGITDTSYRNWGAADVVTTFPDHTRILFWTHPLGVDHVFLSSGEGRCDYAGFVGWSHRHALRQAVHTAQTL